MTKRSRNKKFLIRREEEADQPAVYQVEAAAFAKPDEAELVDKLRGANIELISLVAESDGEVVGHILFSPMEIISENGRWPATGLGPLAVRPDWQNLGIGTALTKAGLAACREAGQRIVFVLGHSDYYPRFGFRQSRPLGILCEYEDVPAPAFMVLELIPGALDGVTGVAYYHPLFAGA